MEGVITVGVALFAITFIVKFPDEEKIKPSWGFLKPHELNVVIDRLNADRGDAGAEKFSWKKFLEPAKVSGLIILEMNTDFLPHHRRTGTSTHLPSSFSLLQP